MSQLSVAVFIILSGSGAIRLVTKNFGVAKEQSHVSDLLDHAVQASSIGLVEETTTRLSNVFASYLATIGSSGLFGLDCTNTGLFGLDCTNTTDGIQYVISEICDVAVTGSIDCSTVATAKDALCESRPD